MRLLQQLLTHVSCMFDFVIRSDGTFQNARRCILHACILFTKLVPWTPSTQHEHHSLAFTFATVRKELPENLLVSFDCLFVCDWVCFWYSFFIAHFIVIFSPLFPSFVFFSLLVFSFLTDESSSVVGGAVAEVFLHIYSLFLRFSNFSRPTIPPTNTYIYTPV